VKVLKILVVDDHALVRSGLRQLLKGLEEPVEVLEAADCKRAFELAALHTDLDLVLLDCQLPDMNGLAALNLFGQRHPELPVLMLSGVANPQMVRQALASGAAGFVSKGGKSYELLSAIRLVLAGQVYAPHNLLNQADTDVPQFTARQYEVLQLLLEGRSNKEISETLHIADETAKNHVIAILRGFGVKTRIQAILAASRQGYVKSATSA
jgi:DNA-binding NarL/FixJ family response regulator